MYVKTSYMNFHNVDLCWAVFRVELDDTGNPLDPVITDCSKKFEDTIHVRHAVGMRHSDIFFGTNQFFIQQCYETAYKKKFIHNRLRVPHYGHWISYTLSQADTEGKCLLTFCELDDVDAATMKTEKAWKTSELSITCAKILRGKENFHTSIPKVLEVLSNAIMPDRLYLLIVTGEIANVMFEWRRSQDLYSAHELFDGYSIDKLLKWQNNLSDGNDMVILSDIPSLDASNNRSIAIMQEHGLKNIIFIPMYYGNNLVGFFVVDNFEEGHLLDVKDLMETVSFFIVSEFVNNKLMDDLKTDILTHVCNRNAFNAQVSKLEHSDASLGIIYADINNLKHVNDTLGHASGDVLIKQAAAYLSKIFRQSDVYRIGGDEFVVLMTGISQNTFQERCNTLHDYLASKSGISMAVGASWSDNAHNIKSAMKIADAKMYENKQQHHASQKLAAH